MAPLPKAMSAVRIPSTTHAKLQEISKQEGRSMGEIVVDLVEKYERARFWKEANASLERLRADPVTWNAYKDEPPYYSAEELEEIRSNNPCPAIG